MSAGVKLSIICSLLFCPICALGSYAPPAKRSPFPDRTGLPSFIFQPLLHDFRPAIFHHLAEVFWGCL